jgi:hypothetical protein
VGNIHKRLKSVYADCAVDRSTVGRWAKRVTSSERGNANLDDEPRSGQQAIQALVSNTKFQLFAMIFDQKNIKYWAKIIE